MMIIPNKKWKKRKLVNWEDDLFLNKNWKIESVLFGTDLFFSIEMEESKVCHSGWLLLFSIRMGQIRPNRPKPTGIPRPFTQEGRGESRGVFFGSRGWARDAEVG